MRKQGTSTETFKAITIFNRVLVKYWLMKQERYLPARVNLANFKLDKHVDPIVLNELLAGSWALEFATYDPLHVREECICGMITDLRYDEETGELDGVVAPYGKRKKALLEILRMGKPLEVVLKGMYEHATTVRHAKYTKVISFVLRSQLGR